MNFKNILKKSSKVLVSRARTRRSSHCNCAERRRKKESRAHNGVAGAEGGRERGDARAGRRTAARSLYAGARRRRLPRPYITGFLLCNCQRRAAGPATPRPPQKERTSRFLRLCAGVFPSGCYATGGPSVTRGTAGLVSGGWVVGTVNLGGAPIALLIISRG